MQLKRASTSPKFRSEAEEADWWDTHDTAEIWKNAKPVRTIRTPAGQIQSVREQASARKLAISIRLEQGQLEAAKKIAARKSIGYQAQIRQWAAEGISREQRSRRSRNS